MLFRTKTILLPLFFMRVAYSLSAQSIEVSKDTPQISITDLSRYVYTLAGREMEGRKSGEPGLERAKVFILNEFKNAGLKPAYGESRLQRVDIYKETMGSLSLKVGREKFLPYKDYYMHFINDGAAIRKSKIKFESIIPIGSDTTQWHFSEKIVRDKLILLFPDNNVWDNDSSLHLLSALLKKARSRGAEGIMVPTNYFESLPWNAGAAKKNALLKKLPHFQDEFPLIYVEWGALKKILMGTALEQLDEMKNNRFDFATNFEIDKRIILKNGSIYIKKAVSNIIGYIPGSEKPNEFVILGAHYDHVGKEGNDIYFGADDNASGTAALLALAQVFGKQYRRGVQPKRTLVFIAFAAEEIGLVGSRVYVNLPAFPLNATTAMINMDMIGRRDHRSSDYIYVIGYDYISSDWRQLLFRTLNKVSDFVIDTSVNKQHDPEYLIARSDQASFLSKGVPALLFFDSMKKDYHQPTDTPDKIDYGLLKKRTTYIYYLLNTIANRTDMLER